VLTTGKCRSRDWEVRNKRPGSTVRLTGRYVESGTSNREVRRFDWEVLWK
jgi:hypothetical protein